MLRSSLSPQKKGWKDVLQSAHSAYIQVELWGILIFLSYAYLLFMFLTTNILLE